MNTTATATKKNESALGIHGFVLPEESKASTAKMTLHDRCDRCGAAAKVRAIKGNLDLIFCGNHARNNVKALIAQDWLIDDQSTN